MAKQKETTEEKSLENGTMESKPIYKDEHGKTKYYLVNKAIKQVEKDGKIVDEATGIECAYYENLTSEEAKLRKAMGQIL